MCCYFFKALPNEEWYRDDKIGNNNPFESLCIEPLNVRVPIKGQT